MCSCFLNERFDSLRLAPASNLLSLLIFHSVNPVPGAAQMMQPYQQSRSSSRSLGAGSHARKQHSISCMKHTGVAPRRCTSRRATVQTDCQRTQCELPVRGDIMTPSLCDSGWRSVPGCLPSAGGMERMASFVLAAWMGLSPLQAYAAADAVQTEAPKASVSACLTCSQH